MFTVSEENAVNCLEGSLDIFFARHFRLSLLNNMSFIATFSIYIILWLLHKFIDICKPEEGWYGQLK